MSNHPVNCWKCAELGKVEPVREGSDICQAHLDEEHKPHQIPPTPGETKLEEIRKRHTDKEAQKRVVEITPEGEVIEQPLKADDKPKKVVPLNELREMVVAEGQGEKVFEAAKKYVAKGYSVIPIILGTDKENNSKYPSVRGEHMKWEKYQDRLPTENELVEWFENHPYNQIGIITGNVSGGLFVLDFDGDGWEVAFSEFLESFPEFKDSLAVLTGSGKAHIYGKCPGMSRGLTRRVKAVKDKDGKTIAHIEFRANNSQCLCPPSIHPCGGYYVRVDEDKEPTIITPARLEALLAQFDEAPLTGDEKAPGKRYEGIGLDEGERHLGLISEAGRLVGLKLSRDEAMAILLDFNSKCDPPLPEHEVKDMYENRLKEDQKNHPERYKHTEEPPVDEDKDDYKLLDRKELKTMLENQTEPRWLWDGILPQNGLSLLLAKPKVGKSVFAFNLALRVSRGEPFLGQSTTQGDVLYLALEESAEQVDKNWDSFNKTNGEPSGGEHLFVHSGTAPTKALKKLEKVIETREIKPKLVIIDLLQKFVRIKKIEDYAEVITAIEPIMAMARRLGCHVLLTHHAPKGERELIESGLGSIGLTGSVDTVILIKKAPSPLDRRSFSTDQRYRKPGCENIKDWVINLKEDDITLELAGTISEVTESDAREHILKLMDDIGKEGKFYTEPMTTQQIMEEIKKTKSQTVTYLKELLSEKKIRREGAGKSRSPYRYSGEPKEMWRRSMNKGGNEVDYTPKFPQEAEA